MGEQYSSTVQYNSTCTAAACIVGVVTRRAAGGASCGFVYLAPRTTHHT